ncbi:hypothetical protein H6P81_003574 [Aristolochia fimbriata]|uniref:Condensation domain-containing protein n=1 Tax=Aristolochia fimbriata TaxID=158543 RepID=A0AAV7FE12_ARIFI|nr:hypothetical protein H6P81_003574 [Aristolochia fimbriata]
MEEAEDHPISRPLGTTEQSWVRGVRGGTGITVLALLLSSPPDLFLLKTAIHKLQNSHPILRSSLSSTSVVTHPPSPSLHPEIESYPLASTSDLLLSAPDPPHLSPLHLLLQRELNRNSWSNSDPAPVLFATHYELTDSKSALLLRLHTVACDRTSAVAVLKELPEMLRGGGAEWDEGKSPCLAVESLIPAGRGDKPFWARGVDLVGYSLNTMRWSHLEFQEPESPRRSEVIRLQLGKEETHTILEGCKQRGIKLCGAIAAAGLIAAHSSNKSNRLDHTQIENYSIVTLIDCRKVLDPVLHDHNLGFYHSAILNTHGISEGEKLWDVALRCYAALSHSIDTDKHFKDMGDLNFLMCKAMDNPGLTPSSSLRTSFMVLFEDPVVEDGSPELCAGLGLEDYLGCSSIHGVGPSIAVFDTIRDGRLDCACVYPSPLHSREQMTNLVDDMKKILLTGGESS